MRPRCPRTQSRPSLSPRVVICATADFPGFPPPTSAQPLTGETFKDDAWNMYRQLVEASSCVDRSLRDFDRCIRGVRALALAWQGLGAAGEVPILDLQGFIELLVNHLLELTDGMRRGTHPMLWTMEMLREARVKVMAWAGENPNLPPLDAVGLTMFSLGEKAQRALAARRMQAQIGLGLGFSAPNGGRGNGANVGGIMPAPVPWDASFLAAGWSAGVPGGVPGGVPSAAHLPESAPTPPPSFAPPPQTAGLPAGPPPAEAEDALAASINLINKPAGTPNLIAGELEFPNSPVATKASPGSVPKKPERSSTKKKKWKEAKADLSPVKIAQTWEPAQRKLGAVAAVERAEEPGTRCIPWTEHEIETLIRGVRKHAGALDLWVRISGDTEYGDLHRSRGAMRGQWHDRLCERCPKLMKDFARWQKQGENRRRKTKGGSEFQDKKLAARKHLSINNDILARDPETDEQLRVLLMKPEESLMESPDEDPEPIADDGWNVREAYPSLFQGFVVQPRVVKEVLEKKQTTTATVQFKIPKLDAKSPRADHDRERMERWALEDAWYEDITARWDEMPKEEQDAARKERVKIRDRKRRVDRRNGISPAPRERSSSIGKDTKAEDTKAEDTEAGAVTDAGVKTKERRRLVTPETDRSTPAPAESPNPRAGSLPIVENLTKEQADLCQAHVSELRTRLRDELGVRMDKRWRAVFLETEHGKHQPRFIAPSGKRLRYIPECVKYVEREGQHGPDPRFAGSKEAVSPKHKPKTKAAKVEEVVKPSPQGPKHKDPKEPKDPKDKPSGKRPASVLEPPAPPPEKKEKKARTSRTARATQRELCIIEDDDGEKECVDPTLLALANDDVRESMIARVKPGVRPEEVLRGGKGVADAMERQGGITLRHDVVIKDDREQAAVMSATNQNSGLKDVWVWLRCVWRNLAGCELGDYVAKNGNVTRVTYVCQSFVRHPRLKVTRVDRGQQETPDTDTDTDEDDGWGWGVNLAKPAGEVTVAQPLITVKERVIDSSPALFADWREYSYIMNLETVGDTKKERVDSGLLLDGTPAREKRPQGEIHVDDVHESFRCSADHLKLMGPSERERYFLMLLRTGLDLRFQYLNIESDVEFDASVEVDMEKNRGDAEEEDGQGGNEESQHGGAFDGEIFVRRSNRRQTAAESAAVPERQPRWWKSSSNTAERKKQYTFPRHPWDPRLLPFADGFATRAVASAAAKANGAKAPVSVVPKLRYCAAFALLPMTQESYGMGSASMVVPENSKSGLSTGAWVVWYTVPRRGVPNLHRFLKAHLGRDDWAPDSHWSSSKLHRKTVEVGYDSGKDLYALDCLQGATHWCDPATIAAYNKDVKSHLKVPLHRHTQAAGEHFYCDYGAVRWGVCLAPCWVIRTPFAVGQDWLRISRALDKRLKEWEKHLDVSSQARGNAGVPNFSDNAWLTHPSALDESRMPSRDFEETETGDDDDAGDDDGGNEAEIAVLNQRSDGALAHFTDGVADDEMI